jgi:hypothetical protein
VFEPVQSRIGSIASVPPCRGMSAFLPELSVKADIEIGGSVPISDIIDPAERWRSRSVIGACVQHTWMPPG